MAEQVILAIGDAAGPPVDNPGAAQVAKLAARLMTEIPGAITLFLGDNAYNDGLRDEYDRFFSPTYGSDTFKGRSRACAGNHDYHTPGAAPYFQVLGPTAAGTPDHSFYSFDVGGWHVVSLNSEIDHDEDSSQLAWLRNDLATRAARPILAFWHEPRWGSGGHGDSKKERWFWKELFSHRAEIVLNGHAHHYERFAPQTPEQVAKAGGIREFIVGSGGRSLKGRTKDTPNSEFTQFTSHGLLKLILGPEFYRWEFVTPAGTVLDSGQTQNNDRFR